MLTHFLVCFSLFPVASFSQSDDAISSYLVAGGIIEDIGSVQHIEAASVTFIDFKCPLQILENVKDSINRIKDHRNNIEIAIKDMQRDPEAYIWVDLNDAIIRSEMLNYLKWYTEQTVSKLELVAENPWVASASKNDVYDFISIPKFEEAILDDSYSPILKTFELIMVNVFNDQLKKSTITMKEGASCSSFVDGSHNANKDRLNEIIEETLRMNKELLERPLPQKRSSYSFLENELNVISEESHMLSSYSDFILRFAKEINFLMSAIDSENVIEIPFIPYTIFEAINEYAQKQLSSDPIVLVTKNSLPELVKHSSFLKGSGDYHVFMLTPYVSHRNRLYRILPFPTFPFPNSEKRVTLNINKEDIFVAPPVGELTSIPEDHLSECKSFENGKQGTLYACLKPLFPKPADGCVSDLLNHKDATSCKYSIHSSNDIFYKRVGYQIYISLTSQEMGNYFCKSNATRPFRGVTIASAFCGIKIRDALIHDPFLVPLNSRHQSDILAYPEPPTISHSQIIDSNVSSDNNELIIIVVVIFFFMIILKM